MWKTLALRTACVLLCLAPFSRAEQATRDEVEALAQRIPVLKAFADDAPPFIWRGSMPRENDWRDFEIVWTKQGYRAALLDPRDATPMVVCTENEYFACDIVSGRVWGVKPGRFAVNMQPHPTKATAVTVKTNWSIARADEKLAPTGFDIRAAVRNAAETECSIERLKDGSVVLTQMFEPGRKRVLTFAPPPSRNVTMSQYNTSTQELTSHFEIVVDGVDFEDPGFAPANIDKLEPALGKNNLPIAKNPQDVVQGEWQLSSRLGYIRAAARGDTKLQAQLAGFKLDWNAIARNDKSMTATWVRVLDDLGLKFAAPRPAPTTGESADVEPR